jgi:predicted nuclease with TOPRIM domain
MNKHEQIQSLSARINDPHSLNDLSQVFEDYKGVVKDLASWGPEYEEGLRELQAQFPELQRQVGQPENEALKTRLNDALNTLRQRISEIEEQEQATAGKTGPQ